MPELNSHQEEVQLPSLYDFLLTQEKLAVEIRRQNKELLKLSEHIQMLNEKFDELSGHLTEPTPEPISQNETPLLIEVIDLLFSLSQAAEKTTDHILDTVPHHIFFRKPSWRKSLENTVDGYASGIDVAWKKILTFLEDAKVSVILPEPGNTFNPNLHRAVERISGGTSYTIAKSVRYGYQHHDHVIRPADVIIYE